MRTFLGYRSILDHHHGIPAADEPVCLDKQFGFHRRCVPDPGRNEVMQLIACAERKPLRHRLNALAVARTDQSRHVERAHLSPCFVTQPIQKRLEPTSELVPPIRPPANHGSAPPKSRPPMSHRKSDLGIPCPRKICQSSASPSAAGGERCSITPHCDNRTCARRASPRPGVRSTETRSCLTLLPFGFERT